MIDHLSLSRLARISRMSTLGCFAAAILSFSAAACSDDGDGESEPPPAAGTRLTVEPGGDTICSRGTPFRFFAYGGDAKRLVIDFQGGGACWNAFTCSVADAIFAPEAETEAQLDAAKSDPDIGGIYKLDDPANPVQGWSMVHVPYCTGDIHWGNAVHQYNDVLTIQHKGFVNVSAVLDWTKKHYPNPDTIFVTGCSAGAYGAIGYASWVAEMWPKADVRVLGDSGAGVITDTFFADSFPNWNALPTLTANLDELAQHDLSTLELFDLYDATAKKYPNMRLGMYNTAFDKDQTFYYTTMGGKKEDWRGAMEQTVVALDELPNFAHYEAPGQIHCIQPYRGFYERESGPTADPIDYVSWLDEFINGAQIPPTVRCTGDECLNDSICNACAGSTDSTLCRWCEGWPPAAPTDQ